MTRGIRSRWALPSEVDPATTRCFQIAIPNDPLYIAAFKGALYDLTKPYAWGNDENHTALSVGARMLEAWRTLTEVSCEGMIQLRECTTNCGIEYTTDGGETWTCISLNGCIADIVGEGIDNAIQNGVIQGGTGQQGPQSPPTGGSCRTYHVRLSARQIWHMPSPVYDGDSVHIVRYSGGWSDGTPLWFCPDGTDYTLGTCGPGGQFHENDDPSTADWHMQITARFDTTWFDPIGAPFVIPDGTGLTELYMQANDATLNDNFGEIQFDVEHCTGGWSHTWDFTLAAGPFEAVWNQNHTHRAQWISGEGWQSENSEQGDIICWIRYTGAVEPTITRWIIGLNATNANTYHNLTMEDGGSDVGATEFVSGDETYLSIVSHTFTNPFGLYAYDDQPQTCTIRSITLYGVGSDPFA